MKVESYPLKDKVSSRQFYFNFEGQVALRVEEIWPNGDAPENPTVEDVVKEIKGNYNYFSAFLSDWNLDEVLQLVISPRE